MLTNIIILTISRRDPLETSQDLVRTFTNSVPDTKHHKQCILLCAIRLPSWIGTTLSMQITRVKKITKTYNVVYSSI